MQTVEFEFSDKTIAEIEKLAASWGVSHQQVILTAIERSLASEAGADLDLEDPVVEAALLEGERAFDEGRVVAHQDVVEEFGKRLRRAA